MFNIKFWFSGSPLVALLALTLFGLGVGAWGLYHQYVAPAPTEQLRRQLKENLAQIDSYYLRLTSTVVGGGRLPPPVGNLEQSPGTVTGRGHS